MRLLFALFFAAAACTPGSAPAPGLEPASATPAPDGFVLRSRSLGESRPIHVYKPPGYDPSQALPVLYMPDGGLDEDFPHVTTTVDQLIRARSIPPILVVGIPNTERRRDLTGPTEVATDRAIAPRVGGSASFRRFIGDELMPAIRGRYRTTDDTGLIGESLAGLFVVETLVTEPALFRRYIAFDPSLWWNAEALLKRSPALVAGLPAGRALFLASSGEPELAAASARLAAVLGAAGPDRLAWTYQPRPDLRHDNIYRSLSAAAITAIYADLKPR